MIPVFYMYEEEVILVTAVTAHAHATGVDLQTDLQMPVPLVAVSTTDYGHFETREGSGLV